MNGGSRASRPVQFAIRPSDEAKALANKIDALLQAGDATIGTTNQALFCVFLKTVEDLPADDQAYLMAMKVSDLIREVFRGSPFEQLPDTPPAKM
jgi:hypothetical protein